jgi:hypothetical protein
MYLNSFGALSPRIRSGGEKTFREGKVFFRAGKSGPWGRLDPVLFSHD